jgi:hypothetical protein
MLGREAKTFAKRLALPSPLTNGKSLIVNTSIARLSIAILRATHLCTRGSRESQYIKSASVILNGKTGVAYHYLNVRFELITIGLGFHTQISPSQTQRRTSDEQSAAFTKPLYKL